MKLDDEKLWKEYVEENKRMIKVYEKRIKSIKFHLKWLKKLEKE